MKRERHVYQAEGTVYAKALGGGANLLGIMLEQSGESRDRQRPNPQRLVDVARSLVFKQ